MDQELRRLIDENGMLKIRTAQLQAENTLLRQQVSFLESVVMNSNKISDTDKHLAINSS